MEDRDRRTLVDEMLAALDRRDAGAVMACMSDDVAGVDETTRSFVRGRGAMTEHLGAQLEAVSSVTSLISDWNETVVGEAAFATCVLHQSYVIGGDTITLVAPTSFAFRVEDGAWRICLFHSVPLD